MAYPRVQPGDEEVSVVLERSAGLAGRVVSVVTGEPVTRFRVTPLREEGGRLGGPSRVRVEGGEQTSSTGEVLVEGLPPGRWAVRVEADGYLAVTSEVVEVAPGGTGDLGLLEMPLGAVLSGLVVDADTREPVAAARVSVSEVAADVTGPDGRFELRGLPAGSHLVEARHAAYPSRPSHGVRVSVEADAAAPLDVELELQRGGALDGLVLGVDGEPAAGKVVRALDPQTLALLADGDFRTGEGGGFRFPALREGPVLVRAEWMAGTEATTEVRKDEVAFVELRPPGARVTGRVLLDGRPVEAMILYQVPGWPTGRVLAEPGYEIESLPPGEWTLRVLAVEELEGGERNRVSRDVAITVPEGVQELSLDLVLSSREKRWVIAGELVDGETGDGLAGWTVWARRPGLGMTPTAATGADGSFLFELEEGGEHALEAMPPASELKRWHHPKERVAARESDGDAERVVLTAWRKPEVEVRVLDTAGRPVAGARCAFLDHPAELADFGLRLTPGSATVDAAGRGTMRAVTRGTWDVLCVVPGQGFALVPAVEAPGDPLEVRLPAWGTVVVEGSDAFDLVELATGRRWWVGVRARPDFYGLTRVEAGRAELGGVPEGEYEVRADGETQELTVVAGRVVVVRAGGE